jgi:hypothetical protein
MIAVLCLCLTSGSCAAAIIGPVRRNPSTVVALAGRVPEPVLAAIGRSLNVVLVRPEDSPDGIEAAAGALRRAAGITATYVLVAADPLTAVAARWREMWDLTAGPRGGVNRGEEFELSAAEALRAWRAGRFELPDYYLVLAPEAPQRAAGGGTAGQDDPVADFYLGPLRSLRPRRVAVVAAAEPAAQAAGLLNELGSLRHGPWWPALDEVVAAARTFYPGSLAATPGLDSLL